MNNNESNSQQPGMAPFPYGFMPNIQMMQQLYHPMQANQMAGMQFNGQASVPHMMPNMPMYLNPYQQMGRMPFNPMQFPPGRMPMMPPMGNQVPMMHQMGGQMPMMPPYMGGQMPPMPAVDGQTPPMGGMPPMGGQMPPMGGQMPPMGGQMPPMGGQMPPMSGQMPMMPPYMGAQMPPIPTTDGQTAPMGGQMPYVHYVMVPVHMGPVPVNSYGYVKKEIKEEDDDSIVECTPPHIVAAAQQRRAFSIANILNQDEVKKEPIDEGGIPLPNTAANSNTARPIKTSDSPIKKTDKVVPPVPVNPPSTQTPDDIPDAPASPDCQSEDQDTHNGGLPIIPSQTALVERAGPSVVPSQSRDVTNSSNENIRMNLEECDEYLSTGSTSHESTEGQLPTVSSLPNSKWTNSFKESRTPSSSDGLLTDESIETNINADSASVKKSFDETKKTIARESEEKTPLPSTRPPIVAPHVPIYPETPLSPSRPKVPPRFRGARSMSRKESEDGGRSSRSRDSSGSPWRTKKSPVRDGRGRKMSPERKIGRVRAHSVLVKGVPRRMRDEKIARYFRERFGRCRLSRVHGQPDTVRIEFVSRRDRDRVYQYTKVTIDRDRVTIHEDYEVEIKEEPGSPRIKEEASTSRESCVPSTIQISSSDEKTVVKGETSVQLKKYQRLCDNQHREMILTAGPIPKECSLSSVVEYFTNLNSFVMDVPFPRYQAHKEYLVLQFPDFNQARKALMAAEHRVEGYVIPVSPPYDVHLQLHGISDLVKEDAVAHLIHTLQNSCGILVTMPWLRFQSIIYSYGYVTFASPTQARVAIQTSFFNLNGKKFRVFESNSNQSFLPFKTEWEWKCKEEQKRAEREKTGVSAVMEGTSKTTSTESSTSEATRKMRMLKRTSLKLNIPDNPAPTLTVGPIPSKCLEECDEYLLRIFDEVYKIPFETEDRHFRVIRVLDSAVIAEMLKDGYLRVGKKGEGVLVSPSFDVAFKSQVKAQFDIGHLVINMQRKYGPILRRPECFRHGTIKLTFGRIQDAMRAIKDSPHLKSLQVGAREAFPNISFAPFSRYVDMELCMSQVKNAERMEQAANIRVEYRPTADEEGWNLGKRHRREEQDDEDVMECSPPQKKAKEELAVIVRVTDPEQWIPDKAALLHHFEQFGTIADFNYKEHLEAVIQYKDSLQTRKALKQPRIKIGGRWLDVLPFK